MHSATIHTHTHTHTHTLLVLPPEPVILDFDQPVYNVTEDSGAFVVCVLVIEGQLEEQVQVNLSSLGGNATAAGAGVQRE